MSYISSNRLRFHYENILRPDLLLKLNYVNIMQVPKILEIYIWAYPNVSDGLSIKNVSLALELLSGQKSQEIGYITNEKKKYKFTRTAAFSDDSRGKNVGDRPGKWIQRPFMANSKLPYRTQPKDVSFVKTSLRGPLLMYNFLDKFLSIIVFFEYTIQYQVNTIQINVGTPIRLFPEIQNHFVYFENFQNIQVNIVTTSLTEKETQLLWAGLLHKEI